MPVYIADRLVACGYGTDVYKRQPLHISQGQGLALVLDSFGDEGGIRFG